MHRTANNVTDWRLEGSKIRAGWTDHKAEAAYDIR